MDLADDLRSLLTLERVDRDLFRGRNANYGLRRTLFGGQVAAQCLLAAAATVEPGRLPHSFHGYFLRAGRSDIPVILEVDRDRDGRSFSARRVVAIQDGEVIFSMVTSFHSESEVTAESQATRFDDAPRRDVPAPEDTALGGWNTLLDVRPVTPTDFLKGVFTDCLWVKSAVSLGDDPLLHRAGLTYLSDLGTGFGQQDRALVGRGGPSIDHSVWFQEDIRADEWVLVDLRPVKARSARGCYHGSLRDRSGALGATIYQEQLLLPGSAADMLAAALPPDEDQPVEDDPETAAARRASRGQHPAGS
jgi:acyl-CoA thioesterase-2